MASSKKRRVQLGGVSEHGGRSFQGVPRPKVSKRQKSPHPGGPLQRSKGKGKQAATDDGTAAASATRTFKIIAGSYEKLLYGIEASFTSCITDEPSSRRIALSPLFIFPAHVSCIKAVAASPAGGKWLATGSADEIVKVWDLRRRKEVGGLVHHEGSITHLTFPSRSHLLSASEDGTICLFRARDWVVLRALKGHKGRVNAVAVHPSGKLALSVGRDHVLRMWDLMRGKSAGSTKLGKEGEIVCWSPSGKRFAVQALACVDIYTTKMALLYTITHPSRIHDIKIFRASHGGSATEYLLVAAEDKKITIYELPPGAGSVTAAPKAVAELVGATNRVKGIATLTVHEPTRHAVTIVSSISSDGHIRLYDLEAAIRAATTVEPIAQYDTGGSRLTCVTMAEGEGTLDEDEDEVEVGSKRKREDEDEDSPQFDSDVEKNETEVDEDKV